ncbi:hypothetical protein [Mycolicibacterium smegmatis]|uniref:hypothetical protein n=1 Tax=Mycolicibacterium smegmatis TaxID=1772 RepID=UPI001D156B11|nr:hypothetical protein [Mycolicibacterium smegmatis]MCC3336922.1 hypothetical protein [Mycolicibacterium smegmatis]
MTADVTRPTITPYKSTAITIDEKSGLDAMTGRRQRDPCFTAQPSTAGDKQHPTFKIVYIGQLNPLTRDNLKQSRHASRPAGYEDSAADSVAIAHGFTTPKVNDSNFRWTFDLVATVSPPITKITHLRRSAS